MFRSFVEKYMSSAAFRWDGNNDTGAPEKTPAQLARESIKVESSSLPNDNKDKDGDEEGDENGNESEADNEDDGSDEEDSEDDDTDDGSKDPPENETDEQKTARLAKEKEEAKEKRKADRVQKRIDRAIADKKAAEAEVERLRAQLAEKPVDGLSEEEVERRATEKANKALQDKQAQDAEADFDKRNTDIYNAAVKADKNFDKNVTELVQEVGLLPRPLVYILSDLDNKNGADVMVYLANPDNVDETEEIFKMTERQMTQRLIRLSDKIKENKKPAKRPSAVPPPVDTVGEGNQRQRNVLPNKPTQNMEDFVRIRNQQEEERRKARFR